MFVDEEDMKKYSNGGSIKNVLWFLFIVELNVIICDKWNYLWKDVNRKLRLGILVINFWIIIKLNGIL